MLAIFPVARLGFSRSQTCDLVESSLAVGKMTLAGYAYLIFPVMLAQRMGSHPLSYVPLYYPCPATLVFYRF